MIYNGFIFFNEFNMLDIRLHELWDVVDKFILVESPQTHRGGEKRLFFNERKDEYKQFESKLVHIIKELPNDPDAWVNENEHRRGIMDGLTGIKPEDYLIITDADEIPRAEAIKDFKGDFANLSMCFYYYHFNMKNENNWNSAMMVRYGAMSQDINAYRHQLPNTTIIDDAGWHFSKVYCIANLKYMFKECLADDLFHDVIVNNLEKMSEQGITNWCGHKNVFKKCEIDNTYPKWVVENIDKFKDYIR